MPSADFRTEFSREGGWGVVLAALVGMAFGLSALPFYSLGAFAKPLAAHFGWPRAVIQGGIIFSMFGTLSSAWAAGMLIDRFGVRRVALCSQFGLAVGFLGLSAQGGNPLQWYGSWFLLAIFGIGTTPLTWSRGIADWFVAGRGRALGIALAGTGFTAFLAPPLVTSAIAAFGWRVTYVLMGASIVAVAVPTSWLFFRQKGVAGGARQRTQISLPGLTIGQAVRGFRFWLILGAFAAITFALGGTIPSFLPILSDHGLSPALAARYASLLGPAVIAGRLVSGWLLDKYWAPAVAVLLLSLPATACVLLVSADTPVLSAILIGFAGGAEFDLMAYLCMRYFGMRHYGQIYAWQWASFSLAAGTGAACFGIAFDRTGSYAPALYAAAVLMFAGPLLLLFLGPYPERAHPARLRN